MKLSTRARYAVRLMIQIARQASADNPVSMTVVARETGISKSYLEQLAIPLKAAGLLHGQPGRTGGYGLAREARDICLLEVVEAAIGPINLVECVGEPAACERSANCETRLIWALLTSRVRATLNEYTLADLSNSAYLDAVREMMGAALPMSCQKASRRRKATCGREPASRSRRSGAPEVGCSHRNR
ncbi:MAG: Rrf2 family transcriptional regulator [Polyangiaceae bacterium]|nr:Rrf2 family transcriptional regulator [Polyangiaceae bacterium]